MMNLLQIVEWVAFFIVVAFLLWLAFKEHIGQDPWIAVVRMFWLLMLGMFILIWGGIFWW